MKKFTLAVNIYKQEVNENKYVNCLALFHIGYNIPSTIINFDSESNTKIYTKEEIIPIVRKLNLPEVLAYLKLLHPVPIDNHYFEYVVSEELNK